MREEIDRLVYPVFTTGLRLKTDLLAGAPLDFESVQKELSGLLQKTAQAQGLLDTGNAGERFLGIQYALACWLDEIFLMPNSPWLDKWKPRILEGKFFQTRDRAWKFWAQAKLAGVLADPDALEVFYLGVVLGFRGDLRCDDAPKDGNLKDWCAAIKTQIDEARPTTFTLPVEVQPRTYVPELGGARQFQKMVRVLIGCLLVLVPVASFLVFWQLRGE